MTQVAAAVAHLQDVANAQPASEFPADRESAANLPGLYAWWVDDAGARTLSRSLDHPIEGLIYAGQAGAASKRSNAVGSATLLSRIRGNHLRGNINSSTFRRTLTALLFSPLDLSLVAASKLAPGSNGSVSAWMRDHLALSVFPHEDRGSLAALEEGVLAQLDPPLNLRGMRPTPVRDRLGLLRSKLNDDAGIRDP